MRLIDPSPGTSSEKFGKSVIVLGAGWAGRLRPKKKGEGSESGTGLPHRHTLLAVGLVQPHYCMHRPDEII